MSILIKGDKVAQGMRLYLSTSGQKATVAALRYSISGGKAADAEMVIFCSH